MEDQEYPATSGLDEAYASYQSALKEIFQNVKSGILQAASESLLNVSDWLLSHVTELGKTPEHRSLQFACCLDLLWEQMLTGRLRSAQA
jgi:hypothetical protein